jgi:hypothetical protein
MKKYVACLFLFCVSVSVLSRGAQQTMAFVRPDLSKAVLGFEITSEEEQGFCDYIMGQLSNAFNARLIAVERTKLDNTALLGRTVLYYQITDAHAIYRPQGAHYYEVSSVLYQFPAQDSAGPVVFTAPNSFGPPSWGNNRPFEAALRNNMAALAEKIRGKKGAAHAGGLRLDSLVREERFVDCEKKAYFIQPEFSKATFGYAPGEGETHDFTRLISSHLGRALHADFRIILDREADSVRNCCAILASVVFNVPEQKVSFWLEQKAGGETRKIDKVYEGLNVKNWNENHIFMEGLLTLYKLMDADMKNAGTQTGK